VLCVLGFASELNEETVHRHGPVLRDCALRITEQTGGVAPVP
jgi:DNA-binding IclR family transcriptional regulator